MGKLSKAVGGMMNGISPGSSQPQNNFPPQIPELWSFDGLAREVQNLRVKNQDLESQIVTLQSAARGFESLKNGLMYNLRQAESGHGKLLSVKSDLESEIGKLKGQLLQANSDITIRKARIKTIESKIRELLQKLSREDQKYFSRHSNNPLLILERSLSQFDRLQEEKLRDQENMAAIGKLHQQEIEEEQKRSARDITNVKIERNRIIKSIEDRHRFDIEEKGRLHRGEMNQKQEEINNLTQKHSQAIEELKQGYRVIVEELENTHQAAVALKQSEVDHLESGLITNVDRFQPLPDSSIKKQFTDLKKCVVVLALSAREAEEGAIWEAFHYVKYVRQIPRKHWKFLLESSIWSILVNCLFSTPFSIFGSHGQTFVNTWNNLFRNEDDSQMPGFMWSQPSAGSEQWRSATFEALQRQLGIRSGSHTVNKVNRSYETHMQETEMLLFTEVAKVTQVRPDAIRNLTDQASRLALNLGIQRCRLELLAPKINSVAAINDYDNENNDFPLNMSTGMVQLAVAPGLRRTGDGRGYNFQVRVEIYKATVYLTSVE